MCSREQYDVALSFWTASFQYLMLVQNGAREIVANDNTWVMVKDFKEGPISPEECAEATRWSDHTISIPLLFNLLHGIELLIKGFLLIDQFEDMKKSHDIVDLCTRFLRAFPDETVLNRFFHKYTCEYAMSDILKRFLKDNRIDVKSLYQAMRYPSPDFQAMRMYACLKYNGEEGVHFFSDLESDIQEVRKVAVTLGRSLEPSEMEGQQDTGADPLPRTPRVDVGRKERRTMSHKVYMTDWIPELGQYAIITTALQDPDTKHYAAEAFVFALDEEPFFDGRRLTYAFDPIAEQWTHVDEAYMHKEALGHARNLISLQKAAAYKRTKNFDIYRDERQPHELETRFIVFGELRSKYEDRLKELAQESWSEDLRQSLSQFLKLTIKIEPFK